MKPLPCCGCEDFLRLWCSTIRLLAAALQTACVGATAAWLSLAPQGPYLCGVQTLPASYLTPEALTTFIRTALAEDVGDGDHSALASIPADARNRAHLLVKGEGMLAGMALAPLIFRK